jgi:carbonic anhydrase
MTRPEAPSAQALTQAHGALTKEQRDRLTPAQVLDELKKGNERFRAGAMVSRDYRAQQRRARPLNFPPM